MSTYEVPRPTNCFQSSNSSATAEFERLLGFALASNLWAGPLRAEGAVAVIDFGDATTLAAPETPPTLGDDHLRLMVLELGVGVCFG